MVIDSWEWFREHTFDKLAENIGVKYKPIRGVDYEYAEDLNDIFYTGTQLTDLFKKEDQFDIAAKLTSPVMFFLYRTVPDIIENIIYLPFNTFYKIKSYIKYNFIKKYHIVDTKLKPDYYDCDTRMVNAISSLVIDFIEIECDHMYRLCYDDVDVSDKLNYGIHYMYHRTEDRDVKQSDRINDIINAYYFFKYERDVLIKEIEDLDVNTDNFIKLCDKMQSKLYTLETKHLTNIIKAREFLWT